MDNSPHFIVHPGLAKYLLSILLLRQLQLVGIFVSLNSHPKNVLCWTEVFRGKTFVQLLFFNLAFDSLIEIGYGS